MKRFSRYLAIAAALASIACMAPAVSLAAPDPSASPSPKLDMSFLLLPAYDIEAAPKASPSPVPQGSGSVTYRVGDEILAHVPQVALPAGSTGPLSISLPPGTPALADEGWEIFPKSDPNELRLILVPLKAGKLTLPSLAIQDSAGKSIGRTNPWPAEVVSAIRKDDPAPQKPVDLKPPAEVAFPWWAIAMMAVVALMIVGAIVYWAYRWSQRKRALLPKAVEPPKPEDEVALLALAELEKSGALSRGEFKKHYFRVSEILKTYIGARYGFDAPENTTRELFQNLKTAWHEELGSNPDWLGKLQTLFGQLDLVKFTDHVPEPGEAKQVAEVAREFVRATRRMPVILQQGPVLPSGGPRAPR
jgi:hypothetical protein